MSFLLNWHATKLHYLRTHLILTFMYKLILYSYLVLSTWLCYSQNFDKIKLDSFFQALEDNQKFIGSVAVTQNGDLLYSRSIGFSDAEANKPANAKTKYRIGSISKTFTTVLILQAVEKDDLSLDETLEEYFPAIPNAEKITILHLLYHRSGLHDFTEDTDYVNWLNQPKTKFDMLDIIANGGSDFEPDTKAEYSNSNFVLLSYILEGIYNESYSTLLQKNIIDKIGLKNTGYGGKINSANNEAYSYSYLNGWQLEPETNMSIPQGAGGIVSTPLDLVTFAGALFNDELISLESLNKMKTIHDQFGMGLFAVPFHEKKGYGHTGDIDGFSASFFHFPEDEISFALTSNGTSFDKNEIVIAVLSAAYHQPFEIPVFTTYAVTASELAAFDGTYATASIPLKIIITHKDKVLIAQGTGQPSFPLDATGPNTFRSDNVGVTLEFNTKEKTMILTQGGQQLLFRREP